MFKTAKVAAYLNNFGGKGDDEHKELKLNVYVTPITYELASEVSPQVADRLFRRAGNDEWSPCAEMPKAMFNIGNIAAQRVTFFPHTDELVEMYGILVENARVSGIQATKPFSEKNDFRLEFDLTVPMDKTTMDICQRFYKEPVYISMEPMQPVLFDAGQIAPGQIERCEVCNEPAHWIDSEGSFFCQKHPRKAKGDVKLIVKMETPKQAEERSLREKAAERAAKGEETPIEDLKDPLVATGEFINGRNSRKKK